MRSSASRRLLGALKIVVLGLSAGSALAHPGKPLQTDVFTVVTVKLDNDRSELQRLVSEGYDIAGVNLQDGTADIIVKDKTEALTVRFQGYQVTQSKSVDVRVAPDSNYKTPDEVAELMARYAADYPHLVRVESIGRSTDGRDIWAIKITDNPEQRETDEPAILFNAMHHAREVMTTEVALDTIEHLLTHYGTDPNVTNWVDRNEIWVVPMLNPDGNSKVWSSNSMWRKNTRGGYGVDINRNYPHAWGSCNGSSAFQWSDTYRGPSAGSEPEVQALMGLVARIQPVFNISYHSYSELVIYPYGCDNQRVATKDVVESIGKEMAAALPSDSGRGHYTPGTSWETLYSVDGSDIDWMYHEHHVIPYVIEVNASSQGFQPAYRWRQPTVEKLRAAWTLLLDKLDQSGVRGVVTDDHGRTQPATTITVENMAPGMTATASWKVKQDGSYHLVLKPGSYRLKFQLGDRSVTHDVTVGDQRFDLDVQL